MGNMFSRFSYITMVFILTIALSAYLCSGAIVEGTINITNSNFTGLYLDLVNDTNQAGLTPNISKADFWLIGNSSNGQNQYKFVGHSNYSLMGIGPNINVTKLSKVSNFTSGYMKTMNYFQLKDGVAFITKEGFFGAFSVIAQTQDPKNLTIQYIFNNNPAGNTTLNPSLEGCGIYQTEPTCINSGNFCFWHFSLGQCMDQNVEGGIGGGGSSGGGQFNPGCFIFDNSPEFCSKINFCYYNSTFEFCGDIVMPPPDGGIQCANITNSTLCTQIPMLSTCCTWTGNSCTSTVNNSCHENVQFSDGHGFCEDWAVLNNQTECDALSGFPYFMPCEWNNVSNKCGFKFDDFFEGGKGNFQDINTEQSCLSAGGTWKSSTYQYTDEYGVQKTGTNTWCEMGFGIGASSCDTSCWACEMRPDGTGWGNATNAQAACIASSLGTCQFRADPNAFNGIGWCDFPHEFKFGAMDCSSDCGSCNFNNNPETACNSSLAGCTWVSVNTSSGVQEWCESDKKTTCLNDCFQCYDSVACTSSGDGGNGACLWDQDYYYCKPTDWGNKEVCFDGIDNDNDDKIDCSDTDCSFDQFCAGSAFSGMSNCPQYDDDQAACTSTVTDFGNCTWLNTSLTNFETLCEAPGNGCWAFMNSNTTCNAAGGCRWRDATGCMVNITKATGCMEHDNNMTACNLDPICIWKTEGQGGFCDFKLFGLCSQHFDQNSCNSDMNCSWKGDPFNPQAGGFCDPICFSQNYSSNLSVCGANPMCQIQTGFCDPQFMGGNCFNYNGNMTGCNLQGNGKLCQFQPDFGPNAPPNLDAPNPTGWCNDKGSMQMFEDMQGGEPVVIAADGPDAGISPNVDISGTGLKDNPNSFAFGIPVLNMAGTAACNEIYGSGTNTTKFYWYLDTDGSKTNNCNSSDNSYRGFEFMFSYESRIIGFEVDEKRLAYRCLNSTWVPTPIILSSQKKIMCYDINGPMLAVDKESLRKFKTHYNESQDMRLYVESAGETNTSEDPSDSAGPGYYTPGTADFKFECCTCPGQDIDGDGFTSEQDPDCKQFKQFGFIPMENGPQCQDGIDNNGNGLLDCDDPTCKYDPFFCGGSFAANENDTRTPNLIWLNTQEFENFAFIKFDTDEPSNGTVKLYNDASCTLLNMTVNDTGLKDSFTGNDFKPWHDVILDNYNIGFSLTSNTTYYYKISYCDPSRNCGLSACLNFTTDTTTSSFVFDFKMPTGFAVDIPQLGISDEEFDYSLQTNATVANNLNVTIKCNETGYKLTFVGMSLLEASEFNFTNAFDCGAENATTGLIGMNTSKWESLLQDTGIDYVKIDYPINGSTIKHCDDNGENCQDVNDSVDCEFSGNSTSCLIPVATGLGFSTYKVNQAASSQSNSNSNNNNNNGGSGGSSGSSSGSSGGVVASSAVEDTTSVQKVMNFGNVKAGDKLSFAPASSLIPVDKLEFVMNTAKPIVKLTVKTLDKPKDVSEIANMYKYMEMTPEYTVPADIGQVTVTFSVDKVWVDANAKAKETVYLYKLINSAWTKLSTKFSAEKNGKYEYITTMSGFSKFAIAADTKDAVPQATALVAGEPEKPTEKPAEPVIKETVKETIKEAVKEEEPSFFWPLALLIILACALCSAGLFFMRKKAATPQEALVVNIKDYIEKTRSEGYTDEQIMQSLEKSGWSKEVVEHELKHHQKKTN